MIVVAMCSALRGSTCFFLHIFARDVRACERNCHRNSLHCIDELSPFHGNMPKAADSGGVFAPQYATGRQSQLILGDLLGS